MLDLRGKELCTADPYDDHRALSVFWCLLAYLMIQIRLEGSFQPACTTSAAHLALVIADHRVEPVTIPFASMIGISCSMLLAFTSWSDC